MTARPGSISNQPAAGALTGTEALIVDQEQGAVIAATAMVVGQSYRIVSIGTTNWQTAGAPSGAVVGTLFTCEAVGTGTGTAQRVDGRRLAASALSAWILQTAGGQFQPLDADLTSLAAVAAQTNYGRAFLALVDQAGARDYIGIGTDDTLTLTGLTVSGLLQASHIHGNIAGSVYAHVKNVSGVSLAAGTPLRITGTVGNTTTLEVVAADAASGATMPALFVLSEALANNGEGHATIAGEITGLNTAGLTPGAALWVPVGGGPVTATRPAANAQQVATVGRAHASTGSIHVLPWPVEDPRVSQADAEAGSSTGFSLWSPERWRQAVAAWWLTVSSSVGRAVVGAVDAAAARSAIGAASTSVVSPSTAGLAPATGFGTITYASSVTLDLAARDGQVATITLTASLELTTSNLANGRRTGLRLIPGASSRTLTFPTDWVFVSAKPASIPANKVARLSIECHGTTNADVVAAIAIQP
jgi:hypothetical protein